jgi:glyoxylase-like metal-dependent hydrolase (beta-lactamase superfamily II)
VFNVYVVEDVLVDAGTPLARRRILRQLRGRGVRTHVVTHAHPDHVGSSHAVCEALGLPLWVGERDAAAVESGRGPAAESRIKPLLERNSVAPHPVARRLVEGDEVAGFRVVDVPGHSQGHIALWRESDRTLVLGDVYFNLHPLTGIPELRPPPDMLTLDPALNRESMRRLAELEPALVLFGHGPPLRDTRKFVELGRSV